MELNRKNGRGNCNPSDCKCASNGDDDSPTTTTFAFSSLETVPRSSALKPAQQRRRWRRRDKRDNGLLKDLLHLRSFLLLFYFILVHLYLHAAPSLQPRCCRPPHRRRNPFKFNIIILYRYLWRLFFSSSACVVSLSVVVLARTIS